MALLDLQRSARNAENCPFFLVCWDNLFLGSSAFLYVHVVEIHRIHRNSKKLQPLLGDETEERSEKHKDVQSMDT